MKSLSLEKRIIFVIACTDDKKIGEAKFKLAEYHAGFGKFDKTCYWSLPPDKSLQGYEILLTIFKHVERFHSN